METITKQLYEGMFLVDVAKAGSDWDGVVSNITKILEKADVEILSIKKWDDRKLAYDIKGQSRGVYIISYFRVDGSKIQEIEKNLRLSEQVMRLLILNAELMTQEDIEKETPAAKAEKEDIKPVEEAPEEETPQEETEPQEEEQEEQNLETQESEPELEDVNQDNDEPQDDSNSDEEKQS